MCFHVYNGLNNIFGGIEMRSLFQIIVQVELVKIPLWRRYPARTQRLVFLLA
jgi:hypothetical protein